MLKLMKRIRYGKLPTFEREEVPNIRFEHGDEQYTVSERADGSLELHKHMIGESDGRLAIYPSVSNQITFS